MSALNSPQSGIGAELRRHRKQQHRTLQDVAGAAGVSLPYLSEVERGLKVARPAVLAAIKTALGLAEPLPSEMSAKPAPLPADLRAHLGACLLVAGEAGIPLARLAEATGVGMSAIRPALRQLEDRLAEVGIVVVDDGATAHLATHPAESDVVRAALARRQNAGLTPRQYEVFTIVVMLEAATHSAVKNARGVESHDHLEALVARGYLERVVLRDQPGRPSRYVPTGKALQELGYSTFEELRAELLRPLGATSWAEVRARLEGAVQEARGEVEPAAASAAPEGTSDDRVEHLQ